MGAATNDFFDRLSSRGHEPLLGTTTGTIRLDLAKSGNERERWLVSIHNGDVDVSREGGVETDCTIRAPATLFDRIASGEENAFAAALRGDVIIEGDSKLLVRLQGLFPSPPRSASRASGNAG
jgi:ubiquinone biosynthesis protein UbiJ